MQSFENIAPYLEDPLVLIGFFVFIAFSFARYLVKQNLFPQLTQDGSVFILKLILSYGFLIGILIITLGFGLKYQELDEKEQRASISVLVSELEANKRVVLELEKNTATLRSAAFIIVEILRDKRFKIISGLFPKENYIDNVNSNTLPDLYNKKYDWLIASNLLDNSDEMRKYKAVCNAIIKTVDRTHTTIISLADQSGNRYVIRRSAWEANQGILRKINIVDISSLSDLYSKMGELRTNYNRVANIVPEYTQNIKKFCSTDIPQKDELSTALGLERITIAFLDSYSNKIKEIKKDIDLSMADLNGSI